MAHLCHPKTTQWVDLILNIGRRFTLVEVVSSNKASSLPWTLCLTSSDMVTRAVGLRHPATHLHHWRLPPYPHPACRHESWLRLVCLRHYGSCPSTVAAGDGARLSLSGDMANLAISRKGREKATGNVKHQGSRKQGDERTDDSRGGN
ncbi:hypothetical protein EMCRGX_G012820 [Ephydatia muelleri]